MNNVDFASKYAGKRLSYKTGRSVYKATVFGHIGSDGIVIDALPGQHGASFQQIVHHGGYFTSMPIPGSTYVRVPVMDFLVDDEVITEKYTALPPKKDNHYPHTCPRCGQPSYNAMYGGWVDCSSRTCNYYAKERNWSRG